MSALKVRLSAPSVAMVAGSGAGLVSVPPRVTRTRVRETSESYSRSPHPLSPGDVPQPYLRAGGQQACRGHPVQHGWAGAPGLGGSGPPARPPAAEPSFL